MWDAVHAIRRSHDRFNGWFLPTEPVTYRDAWRYSLLYGVILGLLVVGYSIIGSMLWLIYLALIVPVMGVFTVGFAVRNGTPRQRLLSLGVVVVGGGALFVPRIRVAIMELGAPGLLLGWLFVLIALFGYAFPEYATQQLDTTESGP